MLNLTENIKKYFDTVYGLADRCQNFINNLCKTPSITPADFQPPQPQAGAVQMMLPLEYECRRKSPEVQ